MIKTNVINPVVRAVIVVALIMALVSGITFAALNSTATLANNSISSATAELLVSTDNAGFGSEQQGLTITNLVPGEGSPPQSFWLRNGGGVDLALTASMPAYPEEPAGGYGFAGWDNVKVTFWEAAAGEPVAPGVTATVEQLVAGGVELPELNPLPAGQTKRYFATFDINPESISGSQAGIGFFNLVFKGEQPIAPAEEVITD